MKTSDTLSQMDALFAETGRKAAIREAECIGCTKCIQACPVDAIIGSAKTMHVVITDDCIGCELCVPPCPVDCIDLITLPDTPALTPLLRDDRHHRFSRRQARLAKKGLPNILLTEETTLNPESQENKTHYITSAIARSRARRKN